MTNRWSKETPNEPSTWYWWRSGYRAVAIPVYVDRNLQVKLFQNLHSVHVANVGGEWYPMVEPSRGEAT